MDVVVCHHTIILKIITFQAVSTFKTITQQRAHFYHTLSTDAQVSGPLLFANNAQIPVCLCTFHIFSLSGNAMALSKRRGDKFAFAERDRMVLPLYPIYS